MRIAVLSNIHGNLTAFEAVLEDMRHTSPDLVFHGGDLADAGSSPVEIVDRLRDLGWQGVMGNTDEMLVRPEALEDFASQSSAPPVLWDAIRQIASATIVAFGHTHVPGVRSTSGCPKLLINTGSVGLSYDGDPRACYLLLDNGIPSHRRVEYSVEDEVEALSSCGLPGAA